MARDPARLIKEDIQLFDRNPLHRPLYIDGMSVREPLFTPCWLTLGCFWTGATTHSWIFGRIIKGILCRRTETR